MVLIKATLSAVLTIIVGLLVLVWPKLLRVLLGVYLIIIGILGLIDF